jgi:putative heme iron utilization protein
MNNSKHSQMLHFLITLYITIAIVTIYHKIFISKAEFVLSENDFIFILNVSQFFKNFKYSLN